MKERIRIFRKSVKLTQAEFAEKIGLTRTSYASLEIGDAPVQERHIKLILAAFPQVSEDWLRTGEGEMIKQTNSHVQEIMKRYGFKDIVGKLLEAFDELPPEGQEIILEYTQNLITKIVGDYPQDAGVSPPFTQEEKPIEIHELTPSEIDEEVERYRNQLITQKIMSSPSDTGKSDAV